MKYLFYDVARVKRLIALMFIGCLISIFPPDNTLAQQPGDANGDGEINILDVTATLNHILAIASAPGNADCNIDGAVNILDVTCELNEILSDSVAPEVCDDGIDNDGDGKTDCLDTTDCSDHPSCQLGQPPGGSGDFFTATVIFGENTKVFEPVVINTQIGFTRVTILPLNNLTGDSFTVTFDRPPQVPAELFVGDIFFPEIQFQIGGEFFASSSGSIAITVITNDRVEGSFDVDAIEQISRITVRAIGSFSLPNGIIFLQ